MAGAAQSVVRDGDVRDAPGKTGGKKKFLVLAIVTLLLLGIAGAGGAWFLQKKRAEAQAAIEEDGEEAGDSDGHAQTQMRKAPPAFLPLDAFVVNLADRDSERFAQIGITLELDDTQFAEQLKAYMPAIRNGILLVLAQKTSKELLTRSGKEELASEIMREVLRPLGIELQEEAPPGEEKPAKTRRGQIPVDQSPVRHVHFSSFIIQ